MQFTTSQIFFALLGALPALLAMVVFDKLDDKRPEPKWMLRKVAMAGALSVIPVFFVEHWLSLFVSTEWSNEDFFSDLAIRAFLITAAPEEAAKALCLWLIVWKHPHFDERLDGIIYCARAGLGFAMIENIGYLMSAQSISEFLPMYLGRALLAIPGHASWAGMIGYFAARRKFDGEGIGLIGGYSIAWVLHGSYDLGLWCIPEYIRLKSPFMVAICTLIPVLIIVVGAWVLRVMSKRALQADDWAEVESLRQRNSG